MTVPTFGISEGEKFELEFMATSELCYVAQKCKEEIVHLEEKMRLYGDSHEDFQKWKQEKWLKQSRRKYILGRIKARQLTLL
jgi:hypothetical protein